MSHVIVQRAISSHLSSNLHAEVDSAAEGAAASMEITLDSCPPERGNGEFEETQQTWSKL